MRSAGKKLKSLGYLIYGCPLYSHLLFYFSLQQRTKLRDGKTTHYFLPLTISQQAFKKEQQEKAPRAYLEPFS